MLLYWFFFNESITEMKHIPEILILVLSRSQWAVPYSLGKQLFFLKILWKKRVLEQSMISISLLVTLSRFFPFQFVVGLWPLSTVWSLPSLRERGKIEKADFKKEPDSLWYSRFAGTACHTQVKRVRVRFTSQRQSLRAQCSDRSQHLWSLNCFGLFSAPRLEIH